MVSIWYLGVAELVFLGLRARPVEKNAILKLPASTFSASTFCFELLPSQDQMLEVRNAQNFDRSGNSRMAQQGIKIKNLNPGPAEKHYRETVQSL